MFECRIIADPFPELTWFRDDSQITEGGRHSREGGWREGEREGGREEGRREGGREGGRERVILVSLLKETMFHVLES